MLCRLGKSFGLNPKKGDGMGTRKKGILEKMVRAVMRLCQGAKVRVGTKSSEEFPVKVGVHQGSVLLPLFGIVVDVVTESARGLMSKIIYADELVVMAENMDGLRERLKMEGCV